MLTNWTNKFCSVCHLVLAQNNEGILSSSDTNVTQLTVLSKAEVYIFRDRGVFIDVYKADDKIATSGATSLADIDLRKTYRAIDRVATG